MARARKKISPCDRLRIIVLGYLVRGPVGGMAWSDLHYVLGLRALGHEVHFLEDSGDSCASCYDPVRNVTDTDPTYGIQFASAVFGRLGFDNHWAYYDAGTSRWMGPCAHRVDQICGSSDLLINVLNEAPLRAWFLAIPSRALIDKDPVFTQIRHLTDPEARAFALQHTGLFTFAENVGLRGCGVPDDGLPWEPTRHPIFLENWPKIPGSKSGRFTTVMLWDSYRKLEYGGRWYGMKSDSFGPYADLPRRAGRVFEVAVGSSTAPRNALREQGWYVADPLKVARRPANYQTYIQRSKAEFSVAKHGYVVSRSGWFSERSGAYLATGRPVLVQDTGFSYQLPTGAGLFRFNNPDEAIGGLEEINSRYDFHCRAAREIAEEFFDSGKILQHLIERAANLRGPLAPKSLSVREG